MEQLVLGGDLPGCEDRGCQPAAQRVGPEGREADPGRAETMPRGFLCTSMVRMRVVSPSAGTVATAGIPLSSSVIFTNTLLAAETT